MANSVRPRPHQAGDAHDLASPDAEIDVLDHLSFGMDGVIDRPVLDVEHRFADLRATLREAVREIAVDHAADDAVFLDRLCVTVDAVDGAAVTQHRDVVGNLGDLVELVRDQDRADALLAEGHQTFEQRGAVGFVEARRRLVQNQHPHPLGQRLCDLDQLLLADAEIGDQRVRRFLEADLRQQFPRTPVDLVAVDHAELRRRMRQEDILRDRHQRNQRQLLMDDDDAERLGIVDVAEATLLALEDDGALVAAMRIDPAEHLHQRRLAGAVLADEGVDLPGLDLEVDVAQRLHTGKALADVAHLQHCGHRIILPNLSTSSWPGLVPVMTSTWTYASSLIESCLSHARGERKKKQSHWNCDFL
ncbi:hypothetical protein ABIA43_005529 [Bradyrhizobium sp. USDA 328]